jgi:hypothetical protein
MLFPALFVRMCHWSAMTLFELSSSSVFSFEHDRLGGLSAALSIALQPSSRGLERSMEHPFPDCHRQLSPQRAKKTPASPRK